MGGCPFLPGLHLAFFPRQLPFHAYLFGICGAGFAQIRSVQRDLADDKASVPLPSVGRERIRPGALTAGLFFLPAMPCGCSERLQRVPWPPKPTDMLSVLIPNYNYNCLALVRDLHKQLQESAEVFEILVFEDGSTRCVEDNSPMEQLPHVRHIVYKENRGRYRMRFLMPTLARFPYLLCIDSDARVVRPDFIRKYLSYAKAGTKDVLVGGLASRPETVQDAGHSLRLAYERERESRRDIKKGLSCFNCMIPAAMMRKLEVDEGFPEGYGHEDMVIGLELKRLGAKIVQIDNPLLHLGLDTNAAMLDKSVDAGRVLWALYRSGRYPAVAEESRLLHAYLRIRRMGLCWLLDLTYGAVRKRLRKNLLSADPRMRDFDFFRLGEMSRAAASLK